MTFSPLLKGAFELHNHFAPSNFPRVQNIKEGIADMRAAKMAGALLKAHEHPTTVVAATVKYYEPDMEIYGGVALNHHTGGFSPAVVDSAIRGGAKAIWMSTISSQAHMDDFAKKKTALFGGGKTGAQPEKGLRIWDDEENILPEVHQILDQIAEADIMLITGHLSPREVDVLVDAATDHGVQKILVQHVDVPIVPISLEQQKSLAAKGAILEKCYLSCSKDFGEEAITVEAMADTIKEIGAASCVLVTDYGQEHNIPPIQALSNFAEEMKAHGIAEDEIRTMLVDNPRKLLGL